MAQEIHEYFKKELVDFKILVRVAPESLEGLELIVSKEGQMQKTKRKFDEEIFEDLAEDEFEKCSPLEFNLYLKGLA